MTSKAYTMNYMMTSVRYQSNEKWQYNMPTYVPSSQLHPCFLLYCNVTSFTLVLVSNVVVFLKNFTITYLPVTDCTIFLLNNVVF